MDELDLFSRMTEIELSETYTSIFPVSTELADQISEHRRWLKSIRRERPSASHRYHIGVYIRYFNQTKYENYIYYHKKQFKETIALCPNWELVDFYVDNGSSAPNMESAEEWRRLMDDCMDGRIDLILTQKTSNISKKSYEAALCARLLAAQQPPIGIYFISEDLFTLASYYQDDLHDNEFFPNEDWKILPENEPAEARLALND